MFGWSCQWPLSRVRATSNAGDKIMHEAGLVTPPARLGGTSLLPSEVRDVGYSA